MSNEKTTIHKIKCFNCKKSPVYYKDTTMSINCSDCIDGEMCDNCADDAEFPHVVEHVEQGCPFGHIARDTTKSGALSLWVGRQNAKSR